MSGTRTSGELDALQASIPALEGAEVARMVSLSMLVLVLYDWAITLDDEVKYFWRGDWSMSRLLFLLNRYLVPGIVAIDIVAFFTEDPVQSFCKPLLQSVFFLNIMGLAIIQLMLVLRIYHLFSHSAFLRILVVCAFASSLAISLYFTYVAMRDLVLLVTISDIRPMLRQMPYTPPSLMGCRASRPVDYWRIILPSLILHTFLYLLTALQAVQNRQLLKRAPMFQRLLRDGGFFYLVVLVSVTISSIGSFLTNEPLINVPSIFSPYTITVTSIALSRVLLSIHSFSSRLGSDTPWVLNVHELQGLKWRQGGSRSEIYVDVGEDVAEDESSVGHGHGLGSALSFDVEGGKGDVFALRDRW